MQPQPSSPPTDTRYLLPGLELHLTSPLDTCDLTYPAAGFVRLDSADAAWDGGSVRIRSLVSGLAEEAFLDERGAFAGDVELQPRRTIPWSSPSATAWAARGRASSPWCGIRAATVNEPEA